MSELTKDFMKFVSEVVLILLILWTLFSGSGLASTTFNFMTYIMPLTIQNSVARDISVASYAPGEFTSVIDTSGSANTIEITKTDNVYYVDITPSKEDMVKTKYEGITKIPIMSSCDIEPLSPNTFILKSETKFITVTKTVTGDKCKVTLT